MKAWLSGVELFPVSHSFISHPSAFILPSSGVEDLKRTLKRPRRSRDEVTEEIPPRGGRGAVARVCRVGGRAGARAAPEPEGERDADRRRHGHNNHIQPPRG